MTDMAEVVDVYLSDLGILLSSAKFLQVVLVIVAGLVTYAIALGTKHAREFFKIKQGLASIPAAPGENWLLGHVIPLSQAPAWDVMVGWLDNTSIVKFRLFSKHGVVVGDPHSMKRIFQTRERHYEKDLYWSYYHFLDILGSGLVTANGELWRNQRKLIGPALRLDILDDVIVMARRAVDRLCKKLQRSKGTGRPVNMDEEFRLLTLQVIGEAVLSLPPEECDRVFPQLYLPVMEESNRRVLEPWRGWLPLPSWFNYRRRVARLNSFIIQTIRERWSKRCKGEVSEKRDMLDRILSALEADMKAEYGDKLNPSHLTVQLQHQLCCEIKTFLLAGHETSAAMLSWALYELTQHPDSLAKVKEEAFNVFGPHEQEASRAALDGMHFTVATLKESLRKYSIVPVVVRSPVVDDELCGHKIPAGTLVVCGLAAVHNMWKSPHNWQPQRFLAGGEYESFDEDIRSYMFLPFIQGPRNCLGQYFALMEARVVLALLVKRFKFRPMRRDAKLHSVIPRGPRHGMEMLVD